MSQGFQKIRLKAKEERRFRQGHPWVYSNELQDSPKPLGMGDVVELHDSGGEFLAYGFANPHSLISFRELTRTRGEPGVLPGGVGAEFFLSRFQEAFRYRRSWFGPEQSFRLVYGEADGLSGLIIDRFSGDEGLVYVVQPHAAGMDRNLDSILKALSGLEKGSGPGSPVCLARMAIVRRDASSRDKEGIPRETATGYDLNTLAPLEDLEKMRRVRFRVPGIMGSVVELSADLASGQKTGFFFDQLQNIRLLETLLLRKLRNDRSSRTPGLPYSVLDLCSYVGQWSAHLVQPFVERDALPLELVCVDASEPALRLARENVEATAAHSGASGKVSIRTLKADVLEPMSGVADRSFDVVIADPPAFIKNRKSIPQGKQAYVQLFQTAIAKVRPGGLVVCCSCSQLLSPEDFREVLGKASRRSGRKVRWIAEGAPSVDHFMRLEFQEGHYLKCRIAQVDTI
jgi:23S rRNA (cytosine1962-C5)-methyltransferase